MIAFHDLKPAASHKTRNDGLHFPDYEQCDSTEIVFAVGSGMHSDSPRKHHLCRLMVLPELQKEGNGEKRLKK